MSRNLAHISFSTEVIKNTLSSLSTLSRMFHCGVYVPALNSLFVHAGKDHPFRLIIRDRSDIKLAGYPILLLGQMPDYAKTGFWYPAEYLISGQISGQMPDIWPNIRPYTGYLGNIFPKTGHQTSDSVVQILGSSIFSRHPFIK